MGCRVIVMAKAPVAGHAKTRLIPALGREGAARLAGRFLHEALRQALAADLGQVELCCDPDARHPALAGFARDHTLTLTDQGEGDIGQRMARAFERSLAAGSRALLIGTDAPALDAAYLQRACKTLDEADAVFGPAADGGYALVGLRRPLPRLFEDIAWSTGQVMAQTRLRLAESQARHVELPCLFDIDEPADLVHVPAGWM